MDGFKKIVKMKTGGSVKSQAYCEGGRMHKKAGGGVDKADIEQDKKIVKKAFSMHDNQLHDGEKTDLTNLKKGGRTKKAVGTVKKYKVGGSVKADAPSKAAEKPAMKGSDVAKEKGKPAGDAVKLIKSKESGKKAAAPTAAKSSDNKYKTGGKVKKMADGGLANPVNLQANPTEVARRKAMLAAAMQGAGAGGLSQSAQQAGVAQAIPPAMNQAPTTPGMATPAMKKGGEVKKMADGGDVDLSHGAYDRAINERPMGSGFADKVHGAIDSLFGVKPAGSVTKTKESVTVSPKKRGGKV